MSLSPGMQAGIGITALFVLIFIGLLLLYFFKKYIRKSKPEKQKKSNIPLSDVKDAELETIREEEHKALAVKNKTPIGNVESHERPRVGTAVPSHLSKEEEKGGVKNCESPLLSFGPVNFVYEVVEEDSCRNLSEEEDSDDDLTQPSP